MPPPAQSGLTLSILERLTSPPSPGDGARNFRYSVSIPEIADSIETHLEALLNTRRSDSDSDLRFEHCNESLLNYGILDISSVSLANPADCERIRRSMERALRLFEPRLLRPEVKMEKFDPRESAVRFRIDAAISIGMESEPVVFDALLAKDSQQFRVSSGG